MQTADAKAGAVSSDELKALVGDIDDDRAIAILKLAPSVAELEQAAIWAAGNGDVLSRSGHPMTEKIAAIVEILIADEDEPPRVR
jgi:hypothetical protein